MDKGVVDGLSPEILVYLSSGSSWCGGRIGGVVFKGVLSVFPGVAEDQIILRPHEGKPLNPEKG